MSRHKVGIPAISSHVIITTDVPLILRVQDIIFLLLAIHIMGHFLGFFEGAKKVEAP
jgi:hypothetical protein